MSAPGVGVLLALSGEDSGILRALNRAGSGMSVVRRCADLPELLSAGMAGLAPLALLDTGFDEVDRTVLDRLGRAGLSGVLLVEPTEQGRWDSAGWPVERRDAAPERICSLLQSVARARAAGPGGPGGPGGMPGGGMPAGPGAVPGAPPVIPPGTGRQEPGYQGRGPAPGPVSAPAPGPVAGPEAAPAPASPGRSWAQLSAQPSGQPMTPAEETRWLEELWREPSVQPDRAPGSTGQPGPGSPVGEPDGQPYGADAAGPGRLVVVWGTHGAPGRSTVAASLAYGLAQAGGAVLVDADVEAPCLVQLLGMPDDSSALAGAARLATHGRLDAESFAALLAPVTASLSLLGGLGRAGRWRELPPPSMNEVWLQCRRSAAWTVVDVAGGALDDQVDGFTFEPGRGAVAAELVAAADVVVVVGAADPVGVRRLLQLLADLRDTSWDAAGGAAAAPTGRVEVVINRVRPSAAGPSPHRALREAMGRYGGLDQVTLLPEDATSADRCLLEGRTVLEGAPASDLGRALAELVDRVDPGPGARARAGGASAGRRLGRLGSFLGSAVGSVMRSAVGPAMGSAARSGSRRRQGARPLEQPVAQAVRPLSPAPPPPPPPPPGPGRAREAARPSEGGHAYQARRPGRHRQ